MDKERERLIGVRLRAFREMLQIPRSRFAVTIGLGGERIASYEAGRAPLRYEVFRAVTQHYHISPRWLATEVGSPKLPTPFNDAAILGLVKPRALFSEVYDMHLAAGLEKERVEAESHLNVVVKTMDPLLEFLRDDSFPMSTRRKWAKRFLNKLVPLKKKMSRDLKLRKRVREKVVKLSELTNSLTSCNVLGMQSEWTVFKRRLQDATAKPGVKTKLAEFLGLDLTRVSQWLTDSKNAREPGAEYALKMLRWVEQQERQK